MIRWSCCSQGEPHHVDCRQAEVEDVTELVEEGQRLVVLEERRCRIGWFGEVGNNGGDRFPVGTIL